ncbi:OmpA family protein [Streptomyces sp. NBC_01549]|uniref:OmpA family protein n=1 Tax=Streptomyces sp. NBC_01549 TaxID=2975874 RepID=UPI00225A41D9|nr:OmpA family protein [Streptomyces sp. NBC_01549]MCX4598264.1 OmpA family protein [Streptomyces sp. NBC_01549]
MRTARTRITVPLLALAAVAGVLVAAGGPARPAAAAPASSALASASDTPTGIDPRSPGLALRNGADLAPSRILDLSSEAHGISEVVEDQEGAERREDTGTEVTFDLQAEVLFAKDSARLSSSATSRIASVAREIRPRPGTQVRVYGFTDDLGSSSHGDILSRQRAVAVQGVLAEELSGTAVTFETRGFGERRPAASNATEAGREKNRRVEISFSRTAGSQSSSGAANAP